MPMTAPRTTPLRLLLVEDDDRLRGSVELQLADAGYLVRGVATAEAAWSLLAPDRANGTAGTTAPGPATLGPPDPAALPCDLLLLDVRLPGMSGVDLLRRLAERARVPPTIVVSGEATVGEAVEALKLGVHDFLEKPFSRERLLRSIHNCLEHAALRERVAALEAVVRGSGPLLGASPAMERLRTSIARVAPTDGRVLVVGETGTGKELVAHAIHAGSRRHDRPFVRLNCAAIPGTLIEAELFGHARGAFTDAAVARAGLFEEADGGTLLLDEIGDLGLELQGRLLRVLEDGRVRRLGESRERSVDVRVIAATHQDLPAAVAAGKFRQDLYFRLAHLPIEVPALRDRPGDVALLFRHFVDHFADRHRTRRRSLDPALGAALERYPWPGNVRELRNLAERLVVFGGEPLTVNDLPPSLLAAEAAGGPEVGVLRLAESAPLPTLREVREQCEREYIELVLQRTRWNVSAAARVLGIQRSYLHEKAGQLGIRRPGTEAGADDAELGS
jgi:two-component system nitrogen regulation response regulator NtrX